MVVTGSPPGSGDSVTMTGPLVIVSAVEGRAQLVNLALKLCYALVSDALDFGYRDSPEQPLALFHLMAGHLPDFQPLHQRLIAHVKGVLCFSEV